MLLNCGVGDELLRVPWTLGLQEVLRVLWAARRSNQSILKKINPELFSGRTDVEAEAPILWPPDVTSQLIGKYSDAGKD